MGPDYRQILTLGLRATAIAVFLVAAVSPPSYHLREIALGLACWCASTVVA